MLIKTWNTRWYHMIFNCFIFFPKLAASVVFGCKDTINFVYVPLVPKQHGNNQKHQCTFILTSTWITNQAKFHAADLETLIKCIKMTEGKISSAVWVQTVWTIGSLSHTGRNIGDNSSLMDTCWHTRTSLMQASCMRAVRPSLGLWSGGGEV